MRATSVILLAFVLLPSGLHALTACVSARHGSDVAAVPTAGGPWHTTSLLDHPLVGRIYSNSSGDAVPIDDLKRAVEQHPFVLLGEKHDNEDHHRLQSELLRAIVRTGRRPALVLEMIDVDQQPALDEARAHAPNDANAIAEATKWQARGWPSFAMYAPIVTTALDASLPIAGGNFQTSSIKSLFHGTDAIDDATRVQLGVDAPLAAVLETSLRRELEASHCGMLAGHEDALPAMVLAQRLRDGSMAEALAHHATAGGAVLIAGLGHARRDRGVPLVLQSKQKVDPKSIVSIAFIEVERGVVDPRVYAAGFFTDALPFDYVWFTPRVDEKDPCAAMHAPK